MIITMSEEQRILNVYAEKLQLKEQIPEFQEQQFQDLSQLDQYGVVLHSLMVLEIILGLEDEFNVRIDESSVTIETLKDMERIKELLHKEDE